ncbi:von Willebrand factor type A domain-containing protein [Krasilnikovia cinnamomea]|uniref:von Willebrand factor type A domain-containing protein n=1 Tax=Krasilnikovia cinnamomea TaxID=349313 RepID=A0A4V2G769_9ACTN|nr:substrate-binding domain-containing protein [Krasilnikovia cinnamomea]RZU51426.1 von Willebrand factor type A domain-containing protein [Krasilnikovia cinnamomea]
MATVIAAWPDGDSELFVAALWFSVGGAVPILLLLGALVLRSIRRRRLGRTRPRLPRVIVRRRIFAASVVVLLAAATGGAVSLLRHDGAPGDAVVPAALACPEAGLRVAAAPEIAPVIQAAARKVNPGGADCGPITVWAQTPAATQAATPKPDVWIPSSSAWLRIAAADGARYTAEGTPLAFSPIVLAASAATAEQFTVRGEASWAALVDGVAKHRIARVSMADPLRDTTGILAVYAVHQAMARTTKDPGIAQLRALTLRSRLQNPTADPAALLHQAATGAVQDIGVVPTTEQQLSAYRRGTHAVELTGMVPADGPAEADYPYAISATATHRDLAERLRAAIEPEALTAAGFRVAATPHALPLPGRVDGLLGPALQWAQYRTLKSQVLVMIDGSGSMNQKITDKAGQSTTKAALLRETGLSVSQLFGDDTTIGLWQFGTPTAASPAHQEVIPLGPITAKVGGKTRREILSGGIAGYRPLPNSGTPLFRSVLDGQAMMRERAAPGTVTLVVVLTDGKDEQSRFAMDSATFGEQLKAANDPRRPVPIIAVGYGANADMNALTAMARTTGGTAVAATDPADVAAAMAQAFLAAHAPS